MVLPFVVVLPLFAHGGDGCTLVMASSCRISVIAGESVRLSYLSRLVP